VREFREAYGEERHQRTPIRSQPPTLQARIAGSRVSACTENDSMQPVRPLGILQGFAFHNAKAFDQMILGAVASQLSVSIL
jgi:hypothetical protein